MKKLEPADAYILPNIPKDVKEKKKVPITKLTESKRVMSGNENWDVYKKYLKEQVKKQEEEKEQDREQETKDDPFEDYMEPVKKQPKIKVLGAIKDAVVDHVADTFGGDLAQLETTWFDLKKGMLNKIKKMEKKMHREY